MADPFKVMEREGLHSEHAALCYVEAKRRTKSKLVEKPKDAADLARRMAKAAGKVTPQQMGEAAYMLLCCAAMLSDPDAYVEWQKAIEQRASTKESGKP
ncbi:MAG: hypothetical protein ACK5X3_16950 [Pseudomonadota bacterium]|jgi:hypothetical protein